jgi:NADH-quinone oxidoreductase subunit E
MLRRLSPDQPESFAFTPANLEWARAQIAKYPEGRQMSAVIPLLWRAQEQEGWLTERAIETVAGMLGMPYIRALEVATFYFMFQLERVGSVAHFQVCGTTSCMICGAEDLIRVCREKIAPEAHVRSADGRFSWEEVECLGACANAPMLQVGKDYYEDLTAARLAELIDAMARGEVPAPGPQNGRFASEPLGGLTSLKGTERAQDANASVTLARDLGDTLARITGEEPVPRPAKAAVKAPDVEPREQTDAPPQEASDHRPPGLDAPRGGAGDELQLIKGLGPAAERKLHELGIYHFGQIAGWTPAEVAWLERNLRGFKDRITNDGWVEQATVLAEEGDTAYSQHEETRGE